MKKAKNLARLRRVMLADFRAKFPHLQAEAGSKAIELAFLLDGLLQNQPPSERAGLVAQLRKISNEGGKEVPAKIVTLLCGVKNEHPH